MENFTMLQFFEWYYPADGSLWGHFAAEAQRLKSMGFDAVWLPPAHKGMAGDQASGYDSYDLYDLGEFDQKGSVRTKYGTKDEFITAVRKGQQAGLHVYADIVLNHMGGADEKEPVMVREVTPENRNEFASEPKQIEAYTRFTFPGRDGKYSQFIWDYQCFSGVDYNASTQETAIYSIQNQYGDGWQDVLDLENGNYDYLMLSDIEFRNPHVRQELKRWGEWYYETVGMDGFRLDAIKHMPAEFFNEWLDHLRGKYNREFYTVGEYWAPYDLPSMHAYIESTNNRISLFDAPLQGNFYKASKEKDHFDLRSIFDNTLVQTHPQLAVTLVENHDTQPLQSLEQTVEHWFRPLAYALILLREAGYPCVFYTDLYGSTYKDKGTDGEHYEITLEKLDSLESLLHIRKNIAYGLQTDYFQAQNSIGWIRGGDKEHSDSGCAVVLSIGGDTAIPMQIGHEHTGKTFVDYLGNFDHEIIIGQDGWAEFPVKECSVSVWARKI
ncbi:alpha-amylase [Dyadobacter sediminis]|uniref:Alpha-amylase n=1 Tax=Dyadobacter sediminis TaxID=1493691 RepID=A0A5R9KMJ7_9BACT|nr:alpha-amylase [Dyadobacter sediminis]TLU97444.1 alpha-amylase [Dyadobacter sediminis]GGC15070.1 alpha-amylase [Dyadobacter sediminis]